MTKRTLGAAMAVALALALCPTAQADPAAQAAARAQITDLVRAAGENIDLGDYSEAIGSLARALGVVRQAALARDPVAAAVEARLGVALALSGHGADAAQHLRVALRLEPGLRIEPRWDKPAVRVAVAEARTGLGPVAPTARSAATAPAEAPSAPAASPAKAPKAAPAAPGAAAPAAPARPTAPPAASNAVAAGPSPSAAPAAAPPAPAPAPVEDENAPVVGIRARALGQPEAGKPLPIAARLGADLSGTTKVVLLYRTAGASRFAELAMTRSGEGYKAQIPGAEVKGPSVQYYVEARDGRNRPLARRGNPDRPLAMTVAEPEPAPRAAAPPRRRRATPAESSAAAPSSAAAGAARPRKPGDDEENPFDTEHDPTKVVPTAPAK